MIYFRQDCFRGGLSVRFDSQIFWFVPRFSRSGAWFELAFDHLLQLNHLYNKNYNLFNMGFQRLSQR